MRKVNNIHEKRRNSLVTPKIDLTTKNPSSSKVDNLLINKKFISIAIFAIILAFVAIGTTIFKNNSNKVNGVSQEVSYEDSVKTVEEIEKNVSGEKDLLSDTSYNNSVKIDDNGQIINLNESSKKTSSIPLTIAAIITFGLGIFAFWKWIEFFSLFNPENAMTSLLSPAVITFLTFRWQDVWSWFNI